jgi:hypothetical protein
MGQGKRHSKRLSGEYAFGMPRTSLFPDKVASASLRTRRRQAHLAILLGGPLRCLHKLYALLAQSLWRRGGSTTRRRRGAALAGGALPRGRGRLAGRRGGPAAAGRGRRGPPPQQCRGRPAHRARTFGQRRHRQAGWRSPSDSRGQPPVGPAPGGNGKKRTHNSLNLGRSRRVQLARDLFSSPASCLRETHTTSRAPSHAVSAAPGTPPLRASERRWREALRAKAPGS